MKNYKRHWSCRYLERKYGIAGARQFMRDEKICREEETGVGWTWYEAHGNYVIYPVVTKATEPSFEQADFDALLELHKKLVAEDRAYNQAGIPIFKISLELGWDLKKSCSVALGLVKAGIGSPQVVRTGLFGAVRIKPEAFRE